MKKILFAAAVLVGATLSSFAQTTSTIKAGGKFSIGLEAGLPTGDIAQAFSSFIGGSIKYELPIAENTFFTVSGGYNSLILKSKYQSDEEPSSTGFVPLKAGIKYYSAGGFFLEGQAGIVFSTEKDGGHAFAYAPGVGYTLNSGFEIGIRYEGWSNDGTVSQVGLRLAYRL